MRFSTTIANHIWQFQSLKEVMAKASPLRSGDVLAGIAACSNIERMAARFVLAELPLRIFLDEPLLDDSVDEVSRLIRQQHDSVAFAPFNSMSVGEFRNWLLSEYANTQLLQECKWAFTPEMVAAVSKLMRNQDLITVAAKCQNVTAFRNTIGLPDRVSVRIQPNHPTDDMRGVIASTFDGLLYGMGDAVIGINPASDSMPILGDLSKMFDTLIHEYDIPTQSCVLTHITNTIELINKGVPVDLVFQSIGGTEAVNRSFGVDLAILQEGYEAGLSLNRGTVGQNVMYFETGQGSALSANAHYDIDQQTCEARAYAVAREFNPLLVNTVVGFIGPEYLADGKQILRAALEDHFCAKLLGLPMGCDVCYTNHCDADQDDMDSIIVSLVAAGLTFLIGVPGADDIMLNYQSTSFHDARFIRETLKKRAAPEFEQWLQKMQLTDAQGYLVSDGKRFLTAPNTLSVSYG